MSVRRLSYLIAICAATLMSYTIFRTPPDYSAAIATCRNAHNQPDEIIQACSGLIEVSGISDSNLNLFLRKRAWAFSRKDEYETALADVDRAVKLMPEDANTWVWRAYIHNAHGDYDATAKDFEQALAINPDRAATFNNRAELFYYRKEYEQALQDYQRVLELDPKRHRTRKRIVTIHVKRGEIDQAIEVMNKAIALSPDDPKLYRELGDLHLSNTKNYKQALKAYLRSNELDPEDRLIWIIIGGTYMMLGDEKLGKSYVEKFAAWMEQNSVSELGLFNRSMFELADSVLMGNHSFKHRIRGMAYSFVGRSDLALSEFEQALDKGSFAENRLLESMRKKGFCRGSCSRESEDFYKELDKYIEHFARPEFSQN
jgi:tetratricopeptide (TPR) repeat protein